MRLFQYTSLLALVAPSVYAASWGFTDATVSVNSKSATESGIKESLKENAPLSTPISLGASDSLKLLLTAQEGSSAKRPHQAFLLLKDPSSGLDISYPFAAKDNGKSRVELTHKDIPVQFLAASEPVDAEIVIGSFGASQPYRNLAFQLAISEPSVKAASDSAERYGKQPEIHHIFKAGPKSPPPLITLTFLLAILASVPILIAAWLFVDVNFDHLSVALKSAPIPHLVFVASVFGLEGIFFLYYTTWSLFQMLPASIAVGAIAFLSGSRALSEVQERRLAGLR